jgi:hypothetical protein
MLLVTDMKINSDNNWPFQQQSLCWPLISPLPWLQPVVSSLWLAWYQTQSPSARPHKLQSFLWLQLSEQQASRSGWQAVHWPRQSSVDLRQDGHTIKLIIRLYCRYKQEAGCFITFNGFMMATICLTLYSMETAYIPCAKSIALYPICNQCSFFLGMGPNVRIFEYSVCLRIFECDFGIRIFNIF